MKVTIYTVNKSGLHEIICFLREHHKQGSGPDYLTPNMVKMWVFDAERNMSERGSPFITINSADCIDGNRASYTVSAAGIDAEVLDIEDPGDWSDVV